MSVAAIIQPLSPDVPSPGDDYFFEVIDGQRVEMPPMGFQSGRVSSRITIKVGSFLDGKELGEVVSEVLFHLRLPQDRNRRPDAAFVSYARWPKGRPVRLHQNAWDVVPNLAIEVSSPGEIFDDLLEKIDEYFRAGVELVWVVVPPQRKALVFESVNEIRVIPGDGELDGGKVLPGFRLALRDLFLEPTTGE